MILLLAVLLGQTTEDAPARFRVRADPRAPLNADAGWAGAPGENITVFADEPFRIRFQVPAPATGPFTLQARRNGGPWADLEAQDFPHPKSKTPRCSIVSSPGYKNGAATADLLPGGPGPFRGGTGVGLADRTEAWSAPDGHGEFEWAVVIRRFADGAELNEAGDVFEFRMEGADGRPAAQGPALRLAVRPGHVGGTYVETPGRIGPWRASNGDLYFVMEPAETSNLFMMVKSSDGGRTWREADGANRPPARDLESVDGRLAGGTLHLVHQTSKKVYYHSFRTSDDRWDVRSEEAGAAKPDAQSAAMEVRSDGSLAAFFVDRSRIRCAIRGTRGGWREAAVIEDALGPQCALGAGDAVHLAYYSPDGGVWYRRQDRDGALTDAVRLASGLGRTRAEYGAVLPLVVLPGDTAVVLWRGPDGAIWERRISADGAMTPAAKASDRAVVQDAVDSQQPAADAVADGDRVRLLFIDAAERSLRSTADGPGGWRPSTLEVGDIVGSWVRGGVWTRADGARVLGCVYDAGSEGGAGMNRFAEILLGRP